LPVFDSCAILDGKRRAGEASLAPGSRALTPSRSRVNLGHEQDFCSFDQVYDHRAAVGGGRVN
ncbi:hypothetical protein, partial [Rhizobium anhuiense]|uniref:hypothetical protein n=1 Tax=Rhizobium anhuiense TaxID=1184720 RepID=UPI00197E1AD2